MVFAVGAFSLVRVFDGGTDQPARRPTVSSSDSPEQNVVESLPVGALQGVRTSRNGRALIVAFVGAPRYDRSNPCSARYRSRVTETKTLVYATISAVSPPQKSVSDCFVEAIPRNVTIPLRSQLGHRPVSFIQDGGGTGFVAFDGAQLARATWTPPGLHPAAESPGGPTYSWTREWVPAAPASTVGQCAPTMTGLSLTQGSAGATEGFEAADLAASRQAAVSQETIHGVQATYYANANTNTLVWYEHGQGFVVTTVLHCSGDTPTPLATMLRFARALAVPH